MDVGSGKEAIERMGMAVSAGRMEATACGLLMIGKNWGHTLRVDGDRTYRIDRLD